MRSTRREHDAQVEEYLLREVHDVSLVTPVDSFHNRRKPEQRTEATQEEIDKMLCSFTIKQPSLEPGRTKRSVHESPKGNVTTLHCLVCGRQENLNLSNADTCSICLSDIEEECDGEYAAEEIRVLPECGHGSSTTRPPHLGRKV